MLEETHPFHALFAGESPAHLFVAQRDGAARVDLRGDQSRTELWKVMNDALAIAYQKLNQRGPKKPLSELGKVLDKLDALDEELLLAERRLEDEEEDSGPTGRKAKRLRADLEDLQEERVELLERVAKATKIALRSDEERAALLAKRAGASSRG